jgi:carbamoyltransferase
MFILGLNAYHGDSSVCLLRDGRLVAAAEEERFRRIKHWAGLPTEAIQFCLREANIQMSDVDHIAINRDPKVNRLRRLAYVVAQRPSFGLVMDRLRNLGKVAGVERALTELFPRQRVRAKIHHIEHHLAHLASAFLVAPFKEAVVLSVDGFGDFTSAAWGMGRGNHIRIDGRIYFPHSLGVFYSALTQYLGFPHFGDEYKVMGLAPYGQPNYLDAMRQIVRVRKDGTFRLALQYFRHHKENVTHRWNNCSPEIGELFSPELEKLLGPPRGKDQPLEQKHKDIARSVQAMYEEAFFALLQKLHARYKCQALALSGGCAMNSVANGKIYEHSPFRKMYLPAAAGDAGGAIGAAYAVWHQYTPLSPRYHMAHAYCGPGADPASIARLVAARQDQLTAEECTMETIPEQDELCRRTAAAVAEGQVIGWFQGRLEWGPRALGNRSIICDPRRGDMKEILNLKIKRRESFRPFAPSVLREAVGEWFETDDDVPFMMQVFQVRQEKRALVPATTHVDGSGRLQTVHRETNPLYYNLIEHFRLLTGVPMVLNTSFNENEPVVCRPEEALDCFLRTKMDILVLGQCFIQRKAATATATNAAPEKVNARAQAA